MSLHYGDVRLRNRRLVKPIAPQPKPLPLLHSRTLRHGPASALHSSESCRWKGCWGDSEENAGETSYSVVAVAVAERLVLDKTEDDRQVEGQLRCLPQ